MKAWLAASAKDFLMEEAQRAENVETGGVLLGYWGGTPNEPVISTITGPGKRARHRPDSFSPDQSFHETEIARICRESFGRVVYLGDWHSHPGGDTELSRRDVRTLERISTSAAARAPTPLMLILAGPPWDIAIWLAVSPRGWHWPRRIATVRIGVELFAQPRSHPGEGTEA